MIEVHILRLSKQQPQIVSIEVKGHAEYDIAGQDLVCAGVSAITVGTMNAIEALTSIDVKPKVAEGFLFVDVNQLNAIEEEKRKTIHLLLESMIVMLQTIQDSYRAYIKIQIMYSKGG